ncbi:dTDP-4-dehydrorhamnose 3,5-epimerase [Citrobacter freundii]|uniref:dTDP-4-dehydrorhamnose 3,5-epimerase n=1 Tax=Citrobacter freundii TaxID=546 RepID=UPI002DBB5A68|nr:dTDP-4-dehydrorhamnose 3,5-epimerase [Citrobacter freundii]MEB6425290.1 dTDP-4-dehydrorhamnose 3,5-epimerase [Citrobacter freundii]
MLIKKTSLKDCVMLYPKKYFDSRGCFFETYHQEKMRGVGISLSFVQDNVSFSNKNVLRGLHFQIKKPQGKLVSVLEGCVFDVVVDLRPDSETFGQHEGFYLDSEGGGQLYVPPGFAHGFCTISDHVVFHYKCSELYDPLDESGIKWNDPQLNIAWPVKNPIVSDKDNNLSSFKDILDVL